MVEMAGRNARYAHQDLVDVAAREEALLSSLASVLGISRPPVRIECFDISTFQGAQTVGSQVTFVQTRPEKSAYKRYKISPENAGDDFAAMREVLTRRIRRSLKEGPPIDGDGPGASAAEIEGLPDLIILDGGVPQLAPVMALMEELGVIDVDIVALAKQRDVRRRGRGKPSRKPERVYKPGQAEPIVLPEDSAELYLIQRIRDEAHRFAITYHRKLRQQEAMQSGLEAVPGLGPKRRHLLLAHFGSGSAVKRAGLDELRAVPGIPPKIAQAVFDQFIEHREREAARAAEREAKRQAKQDASGDAGESDGAKTTDKEPDTNRDDGDKADGDVA